MLTASIVLFKTPQSQIDTIIKSVINSKCVKKLYVIDNSPTAGNISFFKEYDFVEYIPHKNTGYGSSHNIALHKAIEERSDYHVVLNPDIEFESYVLPKLISFMESEQGAVYVLPKVFSPDGELQYLCKLLPSPSDLFLRRFLPKIPCFDKMEKKYMLVHFGYDKIINPPCLSGCFMFMRVKTLEEHNLFFDESYFMYLEDFDLMRRLHRVGKTLFYPDVSIIHNHSKDSYKIKKMLMIHIQSACKYFHKFGWFFDKERKRMNKEILKEIEIVSNKTDI